MQAAIAKYRSIKASVESQINHHRKGEIEGIEFKISVQGQFLRLGRTVDFPDGCWLPSSSRDIASSLSGVEEVGEEGNFEWVEEMDDFEWDEDVFRNPFQ